MLRNQSLGTTLALGFACLLTMVAVVVTFATRTIDTTQLERRVLSEELLPAAAAADTALGVVRFDSSLQAFLTTRAPDDLSTARRSLERIRTGLLALRRARLADQGDRALAATLEATSGDFQRQAWDALGYATSASPVLAAAFVHRYLRPTAAGTVEAAERLEERLNRRGREVRDQISRRDQSLTRSLTWAFGLTGCVGILLALSCVRLVTEPVGRLAMAAGAVEKGDYSMARQLSEEMESATHYDSQNELTVLVQAFRHMAAALEEREERLHSQADRLLAANTQLTALQSLTDIALSDLPFNELLRQLLQRVMTGLEAQGGAVFLKSADTGRLELPAASGEAWSGPAPPGAEDLVETIMESGQLVVCDDVASADVTTPALSTRGIGAFMATPIRSRDEVVGAALVEFEGRRTYTPSAVYLVQVFQERVERALERARSLQELESWRRELERRVQQQRDHLLRSERLASIGMLGGGIAHELRNPLGVISNAVYFLRHRSSALDERARRHLEIIEREIRHSVRIINSLVDFSTGIDPATTRLDLNEIIRAAVELEPIPDGVTVDLSLDPGLPSVVGDETQLLQVFEHLIRNAVQAMEGEGQLRIGTGSSQEIVWARVQDTGPGVPLEDQSRIFEPLVTTKAKGMGLGLSLSRKISEAHGGEIRLVSEPDAGATFTLELPMTDRLPVSPAERLSAASSPL